MLRRIFEGLSILFLLSMTLLVLPGLIEAQDLCLWKSPRPSLKRPPFETLASRGSGGLSVDVTYNVVSRDVLSNSTFMGGGRRIIRHDCDTPDAIDVALLKDIGLPAPKLHNALSTDNGISWNIVGPIRLPDDLSDKSAAVSFDGSITSIFFNGFNLMGNSLYCARDSAQCHQEFEVSVLFGEVNDYYYPYVVIMPPSTIYLSVYKWSESSPYFNYSTDGGITWEGWLNIVETIGTDGFDMAGIDGPLMIDADGDFIAALAFVALEPAWADSMGFSGDFPYPAYTQSTDGGNTWDPLKLVWGTDISQYPRGHSGEAAFDSTVCYVGGTGFGIGYTAFNSCHDNVAVTPDGKAHLTYTMNDTTYGYEGLFHSLVENGEISNAYIGFPENPDLSGESGVAFMPSIAKAIDGHIVVGWTEFIQPDGLGDVCMNVIPAGEGGSSKGAMNVTDRHQDITYQRIVDVTVPTGNPDEWYVDWIFEFYGEGGNAADSTLWHLQATYLYTGGGVEDPDPKGSGIPRAVALSQNYPNPFNPATTIVYSLGKKSDVCIEISNLRGRLVRTYREGMREAGTYSVVWDGRNDHGEFAPSGIYLFRLKTDEGTTGSRKMVLIR